MSSLKAYEEWLKEAEQATKVARGDGRSISHVGLHDAAVALAEAIIQYLPERVVGRDGMPPEEACMVAAGIVRSYAGKVHRFAMGDAELGQVRLFQCCNDTKARLPGDKVYEAWFEEVDP